MKALKTVIFAATLMSGATAMAAEVSGNVAIGSDYFFRGIDQSGGEALSGGFDVGFESGFYVGTWASSIDFSGGLELDYYAGYGGSFSDEVSYDIGYLYYGYPQGPSSEEFEIDSKSLMLLRVCSAQAIRGLQPIQGLPVFHPI